MTNIPSAPLVIDVLGGNKKVAELMETTGKVVSHWRASGKFPANSYVALKGRLKKMGFTAPDELWPMHGVKRKNPFQKYQQEKFGKAKR